MVTPIANPLVAVSILAALVGQYNVFNTRKRKKKIQPKTPYFQPALERFSSNDRSLQCLITIFTRFYYAPFLFFKKIGPKIPCAVQSVTKSEPPLRCLYALPYNIVLRWSWLKETDKCGKFGGLVKLHNEQCKKDGLRKDMDVAGAACPANQLLFCNTFFFLLKNQMHVRFVCLGAVT